MSKYTTWFKTSLQARAFIKKAKSTLPIKYSSDYMGRGGRCVLLEIDGEVTPEVEQKLESIKQSCC